MRYRLRALLIVLAVGPILLAASYWGVKEWQRRAEAEATRQFNQQLERKGFLPVR